MHHSLRFFLFPLVRPTPRGRIVWRLDLSLRLRRYSTVRTLPLDLVDVCGPRPPFGRPGCWTDNTRAQALADPMIPVRASPNDAGTEERWGGRGRHPSYSRCPSLWSPRPTLIPLQRVRCSLCAVLFSLLGALYSIQRRCHVGYRRELDLPIIRYSCDVEIRDMETNGIAVRTPYLSSAQYPHLIVGSAALGCFQS